MRQLYVRYIERGGYHVVELRSKEHEPSNVGSRGDL